MSHDPYPGERPRAGHHENPYDDAGRGDQRQGTEPYPSVPPYQQPYQPSFAAGGYQPGYYQPSPQAVEGASAAQLSLILGIVGFFMAGFVLGPLAIWQASKAERLGVPATAGKILGWIVTILNVLAIVGVIVFFVVVLAGIGASAGYST
ncbi:hypothetical protein [Arthrobacter sp. CP30]